jgi:hypothetical protein
VAYKIARQGQKDRLKNFMRGEMYTKDGVIGIAEDEE